MLVQIKGNPHQKNENDAFLGEIFFQIWVGGVADSKQAPNHTENRLFDPNFTFGVPKSHKNPGVGSQN